MSACGVSISIALTEGGGVWARAPKSRRTRSMPNAFGGDNAFDAEFGGDTDDDLEIDEDELDIVADTVLPLTWPILSYH